MCSAAARGSLRRPRASTYVWYAPRHLPRRGNTTVRAGLHRVVRCFVAYFEHCRCTPNLAAATSSGRRLSFSRSTAPTSTPATPTRHRPRRSSHG
jgi:hypothetical protein